MYAAGIIFVMFGPFIFLISFLNNIIFFINVFSFMLPCILLLSNVVDHVYKINILLEF